ncbi:hypothetical protein ZIOFF_030110 [Zingiber officinale]|uniref:SH3 domain-containing protein n=1 Tax=Zingiber officinale TaxID=94328 RepID=A0A8J5GZG0_ZINOF|nr:hypothetical protein ZIOFF_030110 [Zingiber officinale]
MAGVGDSSGDGAGGASSDRSFGRHILRHPALADPQASPLANPPLSFHLLLQKLIPLPYHEVPVEDPRPPPPPPQNPVVEVKERPAFRVPIPHDLPPGPWEPEDILPPRPPNDDSRESEECGKGFDDRNDSLVSAPTVRRPSRPNRYEKTSRNSLNSLREQRLRCNGRPGYGNDTPSDNPRSDLWHGYPKINAGDGPSGYRRQHKTYATGDQYQRKHMDLGHSPHALRWKPKTNEQRQPQALVEKKKGKAEWVAVTRMQCVNRNSEVGERSQQELTDDGWQTVSGNDPDQIEFVSNFDKLEIEESDVDLKTPKDFEDGSSSGYEPVSGEGKENLSSEDGGDGQEDILPNEHTDSLTLQGDPAQTRINRRPPTPLAKFDGSKPLRRKQISRHGMKHRGIECRPDIETLSPGFVSVYESLLPSDVEKENQNLLLKSLTVIINKEWPNVKLHLYGSCANSFGFSNSDVDICLSIDECESKHDMLLKLADILQSENYQDVEEMELTYLLTVEDTDCAYFDQVDELHNFGSLNDESLAELVWGFFHYWAFAHNYTRDVISVRTGCIISKKIKNWTRRIGNDRHLLCIEDPFETSHDLGRHVDRCSIDMLRSEFKRAASVLHVGKTLVSLHGLPSFGLALMNDLVVAVVGDFKSLDSLANGRPKEAGDQAEGAGSSAAAVTKSDKFEIEYKIDRTRVQRFSGLRKRNTLKRDNLNDIRFMVVWKQFGGGGYASNDNIVTDEAELELYQKLEKLYASTRSSKHFQRDIVRGVEGFIVVGSKQVEIGSKLSEDSKKYGLENSCTSDSTLSKATLRFSQARSEMEKEREVLLKSLSTLIVEPLRAMVVGAQLEDARQLAQCYEKMRQEAEVQILFGNEMLLLGHFVYFIEVSKRQMRLREGHGNVDNSSKLEASETKLQELKSNMVVLGKEAVAAMTAVEAQQQRLTLQRLIAMVESERIYHQKNLQILDQLVGQMVSERQRIETSPSRMFTDSVPSPPSYEEASGIWSSQTMEGSTDSMGYFLGEVVHSYQAESDFELNLSVGDFVVVRKVPVSNGWAEGECKGKAGWFPYGYVEKRERVAHSLPV